MYCEGERMVSGVHSDSVVLKPDQAGNRSRDGSIASWIEPGSTAYLVK